MAKSLPIIGTAGAFKLNEPFNNTLKPTAIYKVVGIRRLEELIASGNDPLQEYYIAKGLTEPIYNEDLKLGSSIVILQLITGGDLVHVPASYIESFPDPNGLTYSVTGLAVSLGAIPDKMDLTVLNGKISELVQSTLGVTPEIKRLALSEPSIVSHDTHKSLEITRTAMVNDSETTLAKLLRTEAALNSAVIKITALEQFIVLNKDKLD